MEPNHDLTPAPGGASDPQIAVLLGGEPASIVDTLMAMPAHEEDEGATLWKRVVERRLADRLRTLMERQL